MSGHASGESAPSNAFDTSSAAQEEPASSDFAVWSSRRAHRPDVGSTVTQQQRDGQQAESSPQIVYLEPESYQRPQDSSRPPIFDLWESGARGGFQEDLVAATDYSLPRFHHRAPAHGGSPQSALSVSAVASQYAPSTASHTSSPLSLTENASSSLQSTVDTDFGGKALLSAGVEHLLEERSDGVFIQPDTTTTNLFSLFPFYRCTFNFLGCRFVASKKTAWFIHSFSHFRGNAPPRFVECPLCGWCFQDAWDGHRAWYARMSHLAAHMRCGHTLVTARPDFNLYEYLLQKRIIDYAEYLELKSYGCLRGALYKKMYASSHGRLRGARGLFTMSAQDSGYLEICVNANEFLSFVKRELDGAAQLLNVMVLVGERQNAFATTCEDYVKRTWHNVGERFLHGLIAGLQYEKEVEMGDGDFLLSSMMSIAHGATVAMDGVQCGFSPGGSSLEERFLRFIVFGTNEHFRVVCEVLRWLISIGRIPHQDRLQSSTVEVYKAGNVHSCEAVVSPRPMEEVSEEPVDGSCWHKMFKGFILAKGFPVPDRGLQRGVELPFDLMTLLGLVLYPVSFDTGIVLKGENTVLIPSIHDEDPECVQWHFLEGREGGDLLTWDVIKKHCRKIAPIKDFKTLQRKRTFVGYFCKAVIQLGTRDSGYGEVDWSGADYDDKTEIVLGNELVGQVGTSVMNFFTAQVSGKLLLHRTAHHRLRGAHESILDKVRNSKDLSMLLYDVNTKRAWLVPELSAILHLALAWASRQPDAQQVLVKMPHAEVHSDGGEAAYEAICRARDDLLPTHIKHETDYDKQITVIQLLASFLTRVSQIKDQQLQRRATGLKETKDIVGYEFEEIASFAENLQLRRAPIDPSTSGGWVRLISHRPEMAVIICRKLTDPIKLSGKPLCPQWSAVPEGRDFLTASIFCLKQLAKRSGDEDKLRLYNDIYCVPAKENTDTEPCGTRRWPCCNPLLELSQRPSTQALRYEPEGALIIGKAKLRRMRVLKLPWHPKGNDTTQSAPCQASGSAPPPRNSAVNISQAQRPARQIVVQDQATRFRTGQH
ncbi:hypothetical protein B0J12DRAFT_628672 [Macrophomina phaseolina]|uniref:Uncharacterized protein n=1 Tax=Macrophomina phaseolina TaxID=35725 RepID=A0ABQ8G492_9PEZI|nr:hypothetical protein B0J12DRAFT_628672 [Macrophomina phaseolina]